MGQSCQGLGVGLRGELLVDGRAAGRLEDLGAMGCHAGVPLVLHEVDGILTLQVSDRVLAERRLESLLRGGQRRGGGAWHHYRVSWLLE